ncbi:MAG: tetratricopeptide repeat protein [Desulfomonile tiedjei]|nr:tetratricopeptide repeat protein [Desulfomonile tiedjei]
MAEKKVTRKELLKEPDEFMTTTGQVITFVRENPRVVSMAAIVAVACVVAVVVFFAYKKQQQARGHELFEKAAGDYEALVRGPSPASSEQLDALFERFDSIAKEYPAFPSGEMALLYSGHVLYQKKDYAGALERYTRSQSTSLAKSGLEALMLYHIATTRFALKEYEEAKRLFEDLAKDTNSPYRREAYASVARIYEAMNKNKEAVQAYKQYLKMFPEAPDAAFVKARIADLSGEG